MDLSLQKIKLFFKEKKKIFSPFFVWFNKLGLISRGGKAQYSHLQADKNLVYSLAHSKIPRQNQLKHIARFLNPKEKLFLKIAILALLLSIGYLVYNFYEQHLIQIPKVGGTYIEGVVGYPQTINPLYSTSRDVDADLARLIYSSLFNYDETGRLLPDLAESWRIENDNKDYIITLKNNVQWHGGGVLNADDVIFTFNLIKLPEYRSPLRATLEGVEISRVDDLTVKITLKEAYADFFSLLTFGIMPKSAWESISSDAVTLSELNLKPIGTGPYMWDSLIKNKGGELKEYNLLANPDYYGAKPYIKEVIFKFFPNYNELLRALNANSVEGASYVPDDLQNDLLAKHSLAIHNLLLPQINAIFFNTANNKLLADLKLRQALAYAIDYDFLISNVLNGEVKRANGPILATDFIYNPNELQHNFDRSKAEQLLAEANYELVEINDQILAGVDFNDQQKSIINYASSTKIEAKGLWRVIKTGTAYQPIVIKLSVPDNGRFDVAESIKKDWELLGIHVEIVKISSSSLNSELIVNHNFEAFLYGQVVGLDPDVISFWHSSKISGQGLNLSSFNNSEVDTLLSEARQAADNFDLRFEKYKKFQEIISTNVPAIFLYTPSYTYVQTKRVRGFNGSAINNPSDRLAGISNWYLKTSKHLGW
ncbi:MAG: peptide ABC transporter substrate-binding protein [Patescibacteria group bacterium]|nr:peptide ABC transporter substrate-binding protein [Patescibacteria group bacterium]